MVVVLAQAAVVEQDIEQMEVAEELVASSEAAGVVAPAASSVASSAVELARLGEQRNEYSV